MNANELFIDINKLPMPLPKDQLYEFLDKVEQGDKDAIRIVVEHNIRLVLYQVNNRFKTVEYDKKDLVSIGNIGLMKSITTFDKSKNINFAAYATRCIDNEILMFLRKLKKDRNVDSLDRIIVQDNQGNEFKLEDTIRDENDMVENYEKNITYKIIREIVDKLPDRDRKIIVLHFGFDNNKVHTQKEIANMMSVSGATVSKLIKKVVEKIGLQLEKNGVIEKSGINIEGRNYKKMRGRKLKTIYEYLKGYTRGEIDEMLSKLTDEEKSLVKLRYGDDLDNPVTSPVWGEKEKVKFYGTLIPRMKAILSNPNEAGRNTLINFKKPLLEEVSSENYDYIDCAKKENTPVQKDVEIINKDDYFKILELLRTPILSKTINMYSPKEIVIASLKLGYIDGKCFSNAAISEFLGIETQEVIDTTKNVLLAYKEKLNQAMDSTIKAIEKDSKIDSPTLIKKPNK